MRLSLDDGGVSDGLSRRSRRRSHSRLGGTPGGHPSRWHARHRRIGLASVIAVNSAHEVRATIPSEHAHRSRIALAPPYDVIGAASAPLAGEIPCTTATPPRRRERLMRRGLQAPHPVPVLRRHSTPSVPLPHYWATICVHREAPRERPTHSETPERQCAHPDSRVAVSLSESRPISRHMAERRSQNRNPTPDPHKRPPQA
jgi:hypothetical protein